MFRSLALLSLVGLFASSSTAIAIGPPQICYEALLGNLSPVVLERVQKMEAEGKRLSRPSVRLSVLATLNPTQPTSLRYSPGDQTGNQVLEVLGPTGTKDRLTRIEVELAPLPPLNVRNGETSVHVFFLGPNPEGLYTPVTVMAVSEWVVESNLQGLKTEYASVEIGDPVPKPEIASVATPQLRAKLEVAEMGRGFEAVFLAAASQPELLRAKLTPTGLSLGELTEVAPGLYQFSARGTALPFYRILNFPEIRWASLTAPSDETVVTIQRGDRTQTFYEALLKFSDEGSYRGFQTSLLRGLQQTGIVLISTHPGSRSIRLEVPESELATVMALPQVQVDLDVLRVEHLE